MVNNYWCDVSKISLVFYYLNNVKGVLAAAAFRLKLLLSKCSQCNYIHTLMIEKCARKEKKERKISVFIEPGHLSLGVWRGREISEQGDFWANTVENSYYVNIPIYSWAGWVCCREDEPVLVLEVQKCTSEAAWAQCRAAHPLHAHTADPACTGNSQQGLTVLHQIKLAS